MQYSLVAASALLAHLTQAHQGGKHGRFHARNTQTKVDWSVASVTQYATHGGLSARAWPHQSYGPFGEPDEPSTSTSLAAASWTTSESTAANVGTGSTAAGSSIASTATFSEVSNGLSAYTNPSTTSATASATGASNSQLTPGNKKAGLSGYIGIQEKDAFAAFAPHISWYSDYTATTPDSQGVKGIGMLWGGDGSTCADTKARLEAFNEMVDSGKFPEYMFGFYEPDCNCPDSAQMTTEDAAHDWDSLVAPLADNGTMLGSPSMCKQKDEDFLTPFNNSISRTWDITSIHVNKPDLKGIKEVVEYYWDTYGKPIWVSEFACVNDQPSWSPCTSQDQVDQFINDAVKYLNEHEHVVAFGPSNGNGLGDVWPLMDESGKLTASGQTYLDAISDL